MSSRSARRWVLALTFHFGAVPLLALRADLKNTLRGEK
jgi:hypothetical protein